jgi:hypothetical protein
VIEMAASRSAVTPRPRKTPRNSSGLTRFPGTETTMTSSVLKLIYFAHGLLPANIASQYSETGALAHRGFSPRPSVYGLKVGSVRTAFELLALGDPEGLHRRLKMVLRRLD